MSAKTHWLPWLSLFVSVCTLYVNAERLKVDKAKVAQTGQESASFRTV